jgi:hypothetical protein
LKDEEAKKAGAPLDQASTSAEGLMQASYFIVQEESKN